jgi:hypothetical protein
MNIYIYIYIEREREREREREKEKERGRVHVVQLLGSTPSRRDWTVKVVAGEVTDIRGK